LLLIWFDSYGDVIYTISIWLARMKKVLVNLSEFQLQELDNLVRGGTYSTRNEAIREALRGFLVLKKTEEIERKLEM